MFGILADLETINFYKLIIEHNHPTFYKLTFKLPSFESLT